MDEMLTSQPASSPNFPLTLLHLRLRCRPLTSLDLGGYNAGMWLRGALSNVMSRAYCAGDARDPEHVRQCPVCWLLAADEHPGQERRGYAIVPPAIPPGAGASTQPFEFGLTLFGEAQRYLPYFLLAVPEAGHEGVGRGRGQFELREVWANNPITGDHECVLAEGDSLVRMPQVRLSHADVLAEAQCLLDDWEEWNERPAGELLKLRLHFVTPTRLILNEQLVKVPDFGALFRRLLRHLDELAKQFCDPAWRRPLDEVHALHALADGVRLVDTSTHWIDLQSHSQRTGLSSPVGGFVGGAVYLAARETWAALMPWLLWGMATQVGKDTVKGNGVFRLEALG